MSDPLTFLMGKFPAVLPGELRYARNHMWCRPLEGVLRFGFTSYAVRLMQDVYFLDWNVSDGTALQAKQQIGHIETSKAVSDLFAPLAGTVVRFNEDVLKDPSAINVDNYGAGWLFEMQGSEADTLAVQEYHDFLAANWEKTQNMLKGHM
jgi:glycine cleavage system H protein